MIFWEKVTDEKMPSYMINRLFLHVSLGLNLMVFPVMLAKNRVIKPQYFEKKNTIFRLKTTRKSRNINMISHVFQQHSLCVFTWEFCVF